MQADDITQQQKTGEGSQSEKQKAATAQKHVHFAGVFDGGKMDLDGQHVRVNGQSPPRTGRKVFLEGYTDSPEFTHVENPVVHLEDADSDEQDYVGPSKFANYQSPMDRKKSDPLEYLRMASFGAQRQATASSFSRGFHEDPAPAEPIDAPSQVLIVEEVGDLMDEDDDEEPEDDTFEFLLK
ncbi:hypothetical protein SLS53_005610 [Cytospora paraplurivora]|uniref:Uncharacterized protein n=1 Tax=Cytospora paraplurivora TaxID=2898453 RepID=A0AAN9U4Q2_9PEZI